MIRPNPHMPPGTSSAEARDCGTVPYADFAEPTPLSRPLTSAEEDFYTDNAGEDPERWDGLS